MDTQRILVPVDFTRVSECAINHAATMARAAKSEIILLHVVPKIEEIEESKQRLARVAEISSADYKGIPFSVITRVGSIYDDIPEVAAEQNVSLIIMGTHGIRGMQFLTGSRALKIVRESDTPFIVVQERNIRTSGYDNIVMPLDLTKETKQKLRIVAEMAQYFDSVVHLVTPREKDEFLANTLTRNLAFAKQYLEEHGVEYTATISQEKSSGLEKAIMKHATSVDADLIAIMNLQENSLIGMLGNQSLEQHLMTNEAQIPVMMIKPKPTTVASGSVLFS